MIVKIDADFERAVGSPMILFKVSVKVWRSIARLKTDVAERPLQRLWKAACFSRCLKRAVEVVELPLLRHAEHLRTLVRADAAGAAAAQAAQHLKRAIMREVRVAVRREW